MSIFSAHCQLFSSNQVHQVCTFTPFVRRHIQAEDQRSHPVMRSRYDTDQSVDENSEPNCPVSYYPTPGVLSPSPHWFSVTHLQAREYGREPLARRKHRANYRPFTSYWFQRNAYASLYFIQRLELFNTLKGHNDFSNCVNFSSGGDFLCSVADDRYIAIWDWSRGVLRHKYHLGQSAGVSQCHFCSNDQQIVTCGLDGQVRISDINSSSQFNVSVSKKIAQHERGRVAFTVQSPHIVLSCGSDANVNEIDLRMEKACKLIAVKDNCKPTQLNSIDTCMAFNPHQFVVSADMSAHIYDRRYLSSSRGTVEPLLILCPEHLKNGNTESSCASAKYNSTARKLLLSYNNEHMYTFNTISGQLEQVFKGDQKSIFSARGCAWFSDDYVLGINYSLLYGWHSESGHKVLSLATAEFGHFTCVEPHPTTPILATSGAQINVWMPSSSKWPRLKGLTLADYHNHLNQMRMDWEDRHADD